MNEIVQLQKNQELGTFTINIPVDQSLLDDSGFLRYMRHEDEAPRYQVMGESFIVPRSYMGFRDERDNFKETCDVTEQYRANWKQDYKHRKEMARQNQQLGIVEQSWQLVSKQDWDEIAKTWVITTLKAPAQQISSDVINKLGLNN